jgi:hypothetical protein
MHTGLHQGKVGVPILPGKLDEAIQLRPNLPRHPPSIGETRVYLTPPDLVASQGRRLIVRRRQPLDNRAKAWRDVVVKYHGTI